MKKLLTLWIPLIALVGAIIDGFKPIPYYFEELGVIENLTALFLVSSIMVLLVHAARHFKSMNLLDKALLIVLVLGSVYFAGEELSWGQHIIGFETPEEYRGLNYQKETNLHNLSGTLSLLLDRLPRTLLTLGVALGGIVFPFVRRKLPAWIAKYVPGREVLLTSVLAVFVSVPNKIVALVADHKSRFDAGEMKEFYIALFILLFTLHFLRVSRPAAAGAAR